MSRISGVLSLLACSIVLVYCDQAEARYRSNKTEVKESIERGWNKPNGAVAWGREITEKDLIQGAVQVGVSTWLMGPAGGQAAFGEWIERIGRESVAVLSDSIKREFTAAAQREATKFAQEVISDLLNRRNPGSRLKRFGNIEFKVGVAQYHGRNEQWVPNLSREGGYYQLISETFALQPYVAMRIAPGSDSGGSGGGEGRVQRIFVRNRTNHPVWVAAHYNLNGQWHTKGFWQIQPGQKVHVFNSNNQWVYFYANGPSRRPVWGGTDTYKIVQGERHGFRKVDTGTGFEDWTYNFNP